jgi:exodeoxyribonuclease VII small subunit
MAQKRSAQAKSKSTPSKSKKTEAEKPPSFELALERLESLVDRLEGGELELEEALEAFEEGVKLSRHCAGYLREAERKVDLLVRAGEELVGEPFEADGFEAGEEA